MMRIALICLASITALLATSIASADTQSFTMPSVSPNPTAGAPVNLTETGTSIPGSTLTVSFVVGGGSCTPAATRIESVAVSGSFSHVTTFTPPVPGTYTICYAFSGPNGSQNESFTIAVAPAPPKPPATSPPPPTSTAKCVTPQLLRHTLTYAAHLLAKADCKLGRVYRPSQRTLNAARRRNGGHTPKLIVVSQTPRKVGTVSYPGAVVAIRLGVAPVRTPTAHR
jgi:hypothetical protein